MISSTVSRVSYPGAGSTGPFAFPFKIQDDDDLLVTKRSSTGVETTLTRVTNYTVSGALEASGTVTLVTALAVGETLVIRRKPNLLQATSLRNSGPYFASNVEDALDLLLMQVQSVQDEVDRSFKLSETNDPALFNMRLPTPEAGKVVTGTGTGFTMTTLDSSAVSLPGGGRVVGTLSAYLANNAVVNVLDFITDILSPTAGIQAAFDTGLCVRVPGSYTVASSIVWKTSGQRIYGDSKKNSGFAVTAAGVDLITIGDSATLDNLVVSNLCLTTGAAAGHVIKQKKGLGQSQFTNIRATQGNSAKSIWENSDGQLYLDIHWDNFDLFHVAGGTVSPFNLVDTVGGGINSCSWTNGRCTYSGEHFFRIENKQLNASTYDYDLVFRNINFEVCRGGAIKALGVFNLVCDNLLNFDMALSGVSTRDFIYIGASTNGVALKSQNCHLKRIGRRNGTLGGGLYDIKLETNGVDLVTIEGGDNATLASYAVDVGSNRGVLITAPRSWTIDNKHFSTVLIVATISGGTESSYIEINGVKWGGRASLPETNFTAPPGSLAHYSAGTFDTLLWLKETGSAKTGWAPIQTVKSGATGARPAVTTLGYHYYDTTLGKPIWWAGGGQWKDATGAVV